MSVFEQVRDFQQKNESEFQIFTNRNDELFIEYAKRWTDIGRETPAAILLPESEAHIQKTVKWAVESSIPFVAKSGGHSEWSNIDERGVIIDLSKYTGIHIDKSSLSTSLRGSITSKEVAVALAKEELVTALGNGNPVGAIPYFLNGGASVVTSCLGFGSDQILSARMIDAKGELIEVTEDKTPELLWALRGAGQFFGLVTELTVRVHPFTALGNEQGVIWSGAFVFPLERTAEVASVMYEIANDSTRATAGLLMVIAPPPEQRPALVVGGRYTGNPEDAAQAYKPLYDLKPIFTAGGPTPFQNINDGRDAFNAKGQLKRFACIGLREFNPTAFLQVVDLWKAMVEECPDAITSSFNFQWDSRPAPKPTLATASCLHDVRMWQNNFIWHTNAAHREKVDAYSERAMAVMGGPDRSVDIHFPNATRTEPIERRYRDAAKLEKLQALKREWDPTGVYTSQLLG